MATNNNTSNKNTEWTLPRTCTSRQQKDKKGTDLRLLPVTDSYFKAINHLTKHASMNKLSINIHPTSMEIV